MLFNSSFFKNARFQHLKSPAEVVVGSLRLVGGYELPRPGYGDLSMQPAYMGQDLLNPPIASRDGTRGRSGSTAAP